MYVYIVVFTYYIYSSLYCINPHHLLLPFWPSASSQPTGGGQPVVYVDGCCYNNGSTRAQAGVGVYWGPGSKQ